MYDVGHGLCLCQRIGHAHGLFRLSLEYGDSLFPAGRIPAGAAVEFVGGRIFACGPENAGNLLLGRHRIGKPASRRIFLPFPPALISGQIPGRLVGYGIFDFYFRLYIGRIPVGGSRPFRAAALTDICLDKAVFQLSLPETLQHFHTVLQAVHKHFVISVRLLLCDNRLDHAAADRIEPVNLRIRIAHGLILRRREDQFPASFSQTASSSNVRIPSTVPRPLFRLRPPPVFLQYTGPRNTTFTSGP